MDWGFVLGLVVIFLIVIGPLIYFGRELSKYLQRHDPESELAISVTPTGNALAGGLVGFWGACVIAFKLAPKSALGSFLDTTDGVLIAIFGSIFLHAITAIILEKLGYPVMKRGRCGS